MNQKLSLIISSFKYPENLEKISKHLQSCLPIDEIFLVKENLWDKYAIAVNEAKNENILLHVDNLILEPKNLTKMYNIALKEKVNVGIEGTEVIKKRKYNRSDGYYKVILENCTFTTKTRCSMVLSQMKEFNLNFGDFKPKGIGTDILMSFTGTNYSYPSRTKQIIKENKINSDYYEKRKIFEWCRTLKIQKKKIDKDYVIIEVRGGLGNRFRTMFCWLNIARRRNKKLKVIWPIYRNCNGKFSEHFKIPADIKIYESPDKKQSKAIKNIKKAFKIDYFGFGFGYKKDIKYELKLLPYMELKKIKFQEKLGNDYIAVQVRRTDRLLKYRKFSNFTSIRKYYNFIDNLDNNANIFLATDSKKIQARFKRRYGNRVFWVEDLKNAKTGKKGGNRESTTTGAILDLFLAADSKHFFGDDDSSFSDTIINLRKNNHVGNRTRQPSIQL